MIYKAVAVTVFPEFQRRLYKILKKSFSVQLGTLNDSEENISIVIVNFYMSERSCRFEKEAAGHYRTDYLKKGLLSCKQYIDRRKALQHLLEECHTWVEFTNFPEGALPTGSIYSDEELPCKVKSQMADAIMKATEKYFREAGNRHIAIKRANCRSVISQLLRLHNTFAVFPFCYLAVCCIGGGRMFSSTYTLDSEAYKPLLNGDYRDKRLAKKKRLAIIRLLDELNNACELTREQQQYSWKYFLQTFGAKIMSSDEELLWHEILNEPISPQKESSLKLPPIELSLLCKEYLQICFPIQPENLYCYNNCSALHMGKYSLFLRQHAQTIDDYLERMTKTDMRKKKLKEYQKFYLKLQSTLELNVQDARSLCMDSVRLIRWTQSLKRIVEDFCKSNQADVNELKLLIAETSLRKCISEQSALTLKKAFETAFNQNRENHISIRIPVFDGIKMGVLSLGE